MIQFDEYVSSGLQPPKSIQYIRFLDIVADVDILFHF